MRKCRRAEAYGAMFCMATTARFRLFLYEEKECDSLYEIHAFIPRFVRRNNFCLFDVGPCGGTHGHRIGAA